MTKQNIWDDEKQEYILIELSDIFPILYKPKIGDKVKFKDNLWPEKKNIALDGGLFGRPMSPEHSNEFIIIRVNNQGTKEEPDYELGLKDYPWLVYFDEMEIIK